MLTNAASRSNPRWLSWKYCNSRVLRGDFKQSKVFRKSWMYSFFYMISFCLQSLYWMRIRQFFHVRPIWHGENFAFSQVLLLVKHFRSVQKTFQTIWENDNLISDTKIHFLVTNGRLIKTIADMVVMLLRRLNIS